MSKTPKCMYILSKYKYVVSRSLNSIHGRFFVHVALAPKETISNQREHMRSTSHALVHDGGIHTLHIGHNLGAGKLSRQPKQQPVCPQGTITQSLLASKQTMQVLSSSSAPLPPESSNADPTWTKNCTT